MSAGGSFTIHLEQQDAYQFDINFNLPNVTHLTADEPSPLGENSGPNASRLLIAAAANCLSAGLLFCLTKEDTPAHSLKTEATGHVERNKQGRLRVSLITIKLILNSELVHIERLDKCLRNFEQFAVVAASIRQGIPMQVSVINEAGEVLHQSNDLERCE